jgi:protein SCO1/2
MAKTKYSYVGISFIILVFGIWVVNTLINRFQEPNMATTGEVPEFRFTNQNGKTITNADYKGKVYVVEFFFTTCPTICPIMNKNMKKVQDAFYGNPDFGIASITIDPGNDTPEVLKAYAENYGATHPHWHFLTGNKDAIYRLSNVGFKLYSAEDETAEGGFEHSGLFALIDKEGNIRSRYDDFGNPMIYYNGLEDDEIKMLIADIKKLL